jgi:protein-S-isoprenylcysteine O-methyltransferase Ste14
MAAALGRFRRAGTPVCTNRPTTALVTVGIYRRTRNPMYVALTLLYAGIALAADSFWALALLAPLLLLMRYGVIAREERYLAREFGARYLEYRAAVRRWL